MVIDKARFILSAEELTSECDKTVNWVTQCLAPGDHDSWTPSLMVIEQPMNGERSITMMALHVPFTEDADKHRALRDAGRSVGQDMIKQRSIAIGCIFSAECWRSRQALEGPRVEPRYAADRSEGLLVVAQSMDGRARGRFADVTRVRGNIHCGKFEEPQIVQFGLLKHFWKGLAEVIYSRYVMPKN